MPTIEEKITDVEEEIKKTPYNKASQHHIGKLKAKLSRLKDEHLSSGKGRGAGKGYAVKKTGDATVVLVGFPSVGKSSLLNLLTNAESKVGAYEFTTLDTVPGVMKYCGATIQLLDVPGLVKGASEGKGRGKEVLAVVRAADLVLMVVDAQKIEQVELIKKEVYAGGIRLNQKPPDVKITKKSMGGVTLSKVSKQSFDLEDVRNVFNEYGYHNVHIRMRGKLTFEELIDVAARNRIYIPGIFVINKTDLAKDAKKAKDSILVSATEQKGIEELRKEIYKRLDFIRIYMKPQGKKADYDEPLIIKNGSRIEDVCRTLHKDFVKGFRYATLSGPSAKFDEQKVGIKHKLRDEDVLTLIIKD
ncbi:OBG GTPase family GTP-binding protein [Candidatus Undinarchaeota archaeon]